MHWTAKRNQMCCFYLIVFSATAFISISLLVLTLFSIVEFISMLVSMHNQNGERKRESVEDLCVHPSQRWRWNGVQGCWWAQQVSTRPHPSKSSTTLFSHPLSAFLSIFLSPACLRPSAKRPLGPTCFDRCSFCLGTSHRMVWHLSSW